MVPKRVDDDRDAHDPAGRPARKAPLATVAQQVLAPLNAVVGFASILADHGEDLDADTRRRYAEHVHASSEALRRLVDRLFEILGQDGDVAKAWSSDEVVFTQERQSGAMPVSRRTSTGPPPANPGVRPVILIVDADRWSRELMTANLAGRGYELVSAGSGEEAIAVA